MIPAAVARALALVETLAPLASYRLSFDRDQTDSFALTLQRLTLRGGGSAEVAKDDLLPLLPRGSHWNPAVGWRSFVVLPFSRPGTCAAAVGVEGVVPHPSRGAFPIMRAFLLPADSVSAALSRLADDLPDPGPPSAVRAAEWRTAELINRRCVVKASDAPSPFEHERVEGPMLRAAAEAWGYGEPKLLRTLMLSDDQAPWSRHWTDKLREMARDANRPSYLVATVPMIRAHFSRATRLTLLRKELLG